MKRLEDFQANLEQQLTVGFLTELEILKRTVEKNFELNIIPFLEIFEPKEYVELMMKVKILPNQVLFISEFYLGSQSTFLWIRFLFTTMQFSLYNNW